MNPDGERRRAVYFAFQGLFMAVLLLMVLFRPPRPDFAHLAVLLALLGGSLVVLRLTTEETLSQWWFQAGLFVGDALVATATLSWTSRANVYLIYLLLVFGSALTRSAKHRLFVAVSALALYFVSGWGRGVGDWPVDPEFWLRAMFLAVSAALMTVLARDTRQAQDEQRRLYEERMVQVGRLATLGRVAGEVAHRIKGPLTTIAVDAEVMAHRLAKDPEALRDLKEISAEVEKCKQILKDLLDLGRIEEMDVAPLDLRDPVRRAMKALVSQARRRGVALTASGLTKAMPVKGDAILLQEAVAAVLQNALEAVAEGGHVAVRAVPGIGLHRVVVIDDGAGISPAQRERIFEPFYTTKKGQGNGLGLSAALRIAAKHGGNVTADSAGPGRGARFTLSVPAA